MNSKFQGSRTFKMVDIQSPSETIFTADIDGSIPAFTPMKPTVVATFAGVTSFTDIMGEPRKAPSTSRAEEAPEKVGV